MTCHVTWQDNTLCVTVSYKPYIVIFNSDLVFFFYNYNLLIILVLRITLSRSFKCRIKCTIGD